ncbi:MAG: hypothetical protein QG635_304, partial [Bacteroidota bacterium]|nr:hypothetical protein [Bacteroidota bacterium]
FFLQSGNCILCSRMDLEINKIIKGSTGIYNFSTRKIIVSVKIFGLGYTFLFINLAILSLFYGHGMPCPCSSLVEVKCQ